MVDQLIGLILLGLGLNTSIVSSNVKGDTTVATQEQQIAPMPPEEAGTAGTLPPKIGGGPMPLKNAFRLNPLNFESDLSDGRGIASRPGTPRKRFNARAFGAGVLKMQEDFAEREEASSEASKKEFENHKAAFRQQLAQIKDAKKQVVVDRLNTNCQNINTKRTDAMTKMLLKLSTILTNVSNRSASAAAAGKDTTSVDTAVQNAQTAIANAQTLVAAQAGTTCTITITSETKLKTDVGTTISGLQANLKTVYDKVLGARKAVSDAIRALALVLGETLPPPVAPAATSSGGTQ